MGVPAKQFEESSLALRGHTQPPLAVVLSLDGSKACTIAKDKIVRLWDARLGVALSTCRSPPTWRRLSQDGERVALAIKNGVVVYDLQAMRETARLKVVGMVAGLGFVHGDKQLGVVTLDGEVTLRDPQSGDIQTTLPKLLELAPNTRALLDLYHGVVFSSDGKWLAQGGFLHKCRVWDAATGNVHFEKTGHIKLVGQVAFRPDGKQLATPGEEGDVRIWDIEKKQFGARAARPSRRGVARGVECRRHAAHLRFHGHDGASGTRRSAKRS